MYVLILRIEDKNFQIVGYFTRFTKRPFNISPGHRKLKTIGSTRPVDFLITPMKIVESDVEVVEDISKIMRMFRKK